ncbi:MAG: hypothetical protein EOM14_02895 [Clostridia bacterium]|nr:hypothetical protein [Clostridia bacterium]
MKKLMVLTALIVVFSLTFALFTGAFAAGIGKYSSASTKSSIAQTTESDDILGTITGYLTIAKEFSFVKSITQKLSGSIDPGDVSVFGLLIEKITASLGS